MAATYRSLQLSEARHRFDLLRVTSYDVTLDLAASDDATFRAVTTIRFESGGGTHVRRRQAGHACTPLTLNGAPLDVDLLDRGRLPAASWPRAATSWSSRRRCRSATTARGCTAASTRPTASTTSTPCRSWTRRPAIFACFDQPDLKAPYTLPRHRADGLDRCSATRPATQVEPGRWELEQTQPLSTYFVTLVAGPYHVLARRARRHPARASARGQRSPRDLDEDADELFTRDQAVLRRVPPAVRHPLPVRRLPPGVRAGVQRRRDGEPRLRHVPRPAGLHQPGRPAASRIAARDAPSRTRWRTSGSATSSPRRGGTTSGSTSRSPSTWATGSPPTSPSSPTPGSTIAYARRQWGLVADQRPSTHPVAGNGAVDAASALQDFDGISYAKGSAILEPAQRHARRRGVLRRRPIDHFDQHRFGNATMHDLFASLGATPAPVT